MSGLKPGHEKILQHIQYLKGQSWLTDSQKFWPKFLFHFTDITNAVRILSEESLLSRQRLEENRHLLTDIASPEIIGGTQDKWKGFVRLYFRPRTPMQYRNEGFRPKDKLKLGAHCPVPVFFLFDANSILTQLSTRFSNGNLRSQAAEEDNSVDFYLSLPFESIYHDASLPRLNDEKKKDVIFHRHAEVIISDALDLSNLKYIVCRSQAEFETLLHLLPGDKHLKWKNKVRTAPQLFFSKWVYIERVTPSSQSIIFDFNNAKKPDESSPFHARLEIEETYSGNNFSWEDKTFRVGKQLKFNLSSLSRPESYKVSFSLDDHPAYQNIYAEDTGIF
jgi:hypothetical protein